MFMAKKVNFSAAVAGSVSNCKRFRAIANPVALRQSRSRMWAGTKPMAKCDARSRKGYLT